MKRFLTLVLTSCFVWMAHGQEICGHQPYIEYLDSIDPGVKAAYNSAFHQALNLSKLKTKKSEESIYEVQVVFHVVYNQEFQNIEDSLIFTQLDVLNECFRRTNADTINTREVFKDVAADTKIQFVMAEEDPDGNPTNGIVRKETVRPTFGSFPTNLIAADLVKNESVGSKAWDTEKYLNIWICDLSIQGFESLLGFAYPPTGASNWPGTNSFATSERQGVVVYYKVIGRDNPESFATGDRTLVHEVGHYLGLRHIWGDGGCAADDFMDDTPLARRASNGCNLGVNTCAEPAGEELPDMMENYMDYSSSECQNMFTADQSAQMRMNLLMFRSGIYNEVIPYVEPPAEFAATGVYPNPVIENLKIFISEVKKDSDYSITIYDALGQEVRNEQLASVANQEISGLNALKGIYTFRIFRGDEILTDGKLIIGL